MLPTNFPIEPSSNEKARDEANTCTKNRNRNKANQKSDSEERRIGPIELGDSQQQQSAEHKTTNQGSGRTQKYIRSEKAIFLEK